MTLVPFKKSHMEAKKKVVNLRDVVNSIGSRQIARGISIAWKYLPLEDKLSSNLFHGKLFLNCCLKEWFTIF